MNRHKKTEAENLGSSIQPLKQLQERLEHEIELLQAQLSHLSSNSYLHPNTDSNSQANGKESLEKLSQFHHSIDAALNLNRRATFSSRDDVKQSFLNTSSPQKPMKPLSSSQNAVSIESVIAAANAAQSAVHKTLSNSSWLRASQSHFRHVKPADPPYVVSSVARASQMGSRGLVVTEFDFVIDNAATHTQAIVSYEENLFVANLDSAIRVWNLKSMSHMTNLRGHTGGIRALVCAPPRKRYFGSRLSFGSSESQSFVQSLETTTQPFIALFSGSLDRTIRVWDAADPSAACIKVLRGHEGGVTCLAVSNVFMVSGSEDQKIRIWTLDTLESIQILDGHHSSICAVYISEDASTLCTGSHSRSIKLWRDFGDGFKVFFFFLIIIYMPLVCLSFQT